MKGFTADDDPPHDCDCGQRFWDFRAANGHIAWCSDNPNRQEGRPGAE